MIGFLGGSFDPVHFGHLNNARTIKQELGLQQLFLLPCKAPVHKSNLIFSNQQRLAMLILALEKFDDLSIDTQEMDRKTPSYTINTLKQIKKNHPKNQIFFIIGADNFATINTWKDYQQFANYAQLVVLPRKNHLTPNTQKGVYFAKTPLLDISSTKIRSKIAGNQNLSGLLPDTVIHYIKNLYELKTTT